VFFVLQTLHCCKAANAKFNSFADAGLDADDRRKGEEDLMNANAAWGESARDYLECRAYKISLDCLTDLFEKHGCNIRDHPGDTYAIKVERRSKCSRSLSLWLSVCVCVC